MPHLTLILGNRNYSSWSLRAWLVAQHSGVSFAEERIALNQPGYQEAIKARSKAARVPILEVRDEGRLHTIWDSLAIAEYFAEQNPALWPHDLTLRAIARSVCAEMHSSFPALRSALPMNCRARNRKVALSSDVRQDIERIQAIWRECLALSANSGLEGKWLFGEWSIADALYAPVVSRFATYGVVLDPSLYDYVDRVSDDPHMVLWQQQAEAEREVIEEEEVGLTSS